MRVVVVYALPLEQDVSSLELAAGATVREAIELSGVLARHPELELHQARLGVWGRPTGLDAPLLNGDRVEVYRSLPADPKEARRGRAVRKRERR